MQARTGNESDEATTPTPSAPVQEGRGGRGRDGRPPLPVPATTGAARDSEIEADEDDMEQSEASRNNLKEQVQALAAQVEEIERKVSEVTRLRNIARKSKGKIGTLGKDRDKGGSNPQKKQQQVDIARREAARSKRMQELMRQVGTIIRQISQHKWAWPFMKPVDVKGLGLHDYHEVVKKPMDLGTIRDKMDAKATAGYKHVQDVGDDIRLVFTNAMTYNQEGSDVHVMAKTLLDKFDEKWKALLEPKLAEEEGKRRQEDKEVQVKEAAVVQAAEEVATEKMAEQYAEELEELDKRLEELKEKATPKFRDMSLEEKRHLGRSLGKLLPENLNHVIQIIAQQNPAFNALADEVDVDIDAQSWTNLKMKQHYNSHQWLHDTPTLWRLHRYVNAVLSPRATPQAPPKNPNKRVGSSIHNKNPSKRTKRPPSP